MDRWCSNEIDCFLAGVGVNVTPSHTNSQCGSRAVAQQVARRGGNPEAAGSNPACSGESAIGSTPASASQAHFEVGRLTTADLFHGHSSTRHGSNTPEVAGRNRSGGVGSYPSAVSGSGGSGSDWSADIAASRRTASGSPTRTSGRGLVAHSIAALQRAYRGL